MLSDFMRVATIILTITLATFIFIGDIILSLLKFLTNFFSFSYKKLHKLIFLPKNTKKIKKKKSFTFSPTNKLKYFFIGVTFSLLFIAFPLTIIIFIRSLPNPQLLSLQQIPQTTKIYDRHHVLLYQFYANQNRTIVKLPEIPKYLQEATIAIEDKNFYQNPGFDVVAIVRAALKDFRGRSLQGGSTITQQLIKTALLTSNQTIQRKIEEVILSFWAERLYSKNQILQMYLNQVAYGGTAWGVESASQTYFGKGVKDIDLAQAAFLAGLPQAPTTYSPFGSNPTLWKSRQKEVLQKMQQLGYINKTQESNALKEKLVFQTPNVPLLAPHFVMYIKDLLVRKYGLTLVEKGGLSVTTTLDLSLQNMAQKIVSDEVSKDKNFNLTNGAALITNPLNGDLLAMVGSHDYSDPNGGAVNVTTSLRQPGSSIKIVTYAAALSHGYTAASVIDDNPVSYTSPWGNVYAPVNYDGRWHGNVTFRTAFANSINIPAVKILNNIGIPMFVNTGRQMGIKTLQDPQNYGLSVTLGSADVTMLDMAEAYGTVANNGKHVSLNPILLVKDAQGNILEQKSLPDSQEVLSPGVSYILSSILSDNNARSMEFGINSPLNIPHHTTAVKTGTTNDFRDNWTIGYTPNTLKPNPYVVTVWVGNNDNSPMNSIASGITGAAPIWHEIMLNIINKQPNIPFQIPSSIVTKPCFGHDEYFLKGTGKNVFCGLATNPIPTPPQTAIIHIDSKDSGSQINIRL